MIKEIDPQVLKTLNRSEFEVLSFISSNADKIRKMTISDLAKETYVSTTTIIRMCKKLGYAGFSELKYELKRMNKEKLKADVNNYNELIKKHLLDVERTCELINKDTIDRIIELITNKNIHFFGKGLSSIACEYITNQFLLINLLAINHTSTHIAYLSADKMNENDVVFILSLSGETHQSLKVAKIAKAKGATVVSITNMGINSLSKLADINLYVYAEDDETVEFDNKSRASVLILFQVILDMYIRKKVHKSMKD